MTPPLTVTLTLDQLRIIIEAYVMHVCSGNFYSLSDATLLAVANQMRERNATTH